DSAVQNLTTAVPVLRIDPERIPRNFAFAMPAAVIEETKSTPDPAGTSNSSPLQAGLPVILQQVNSTPGHSANDSIAPADIARIICPSVVQPLAGPTSAA